MFLLSRPQQEVTEAEIRHMLVQNDFASHVVSLQRELHDWNAIFAFTQSPNGNFAFSFYVSLKAQPDLKFDYNRASYRTQSTTQ